MRHVLDHKTLVCLCGKTMEHHVNIEMVGEKVRQQWLEGDVRINEQFAEIDRALNPLPNNSTS